MSEYAKMVRAILTEDVQSLKSAVAKSTDIDVFDDTGRTPLHIAVMHARTQSIGPLVAAGADVNLPSGDHQTASEMAEKKGGLVQKHLISAKADYEAQRSKLTSTTAAAQGGVKSSPVGTKAVDAMRQQRRAGGLIGDLAT